MLAARIEHQRRFGQQWKPRDSGADASCLETQCARRKLELGDAELTHRLSAGMAQLSDIGGHTVEMSDQCERCEPGIR